jgi:hypothetical protein
MNAYGNGYKVPAWPSGDYDSIFVVRITNTNGIRTAQFDHDYQGFNNLSTSCPQ